MAEAILARKGLLHDPVGTYSSPTAIATTHNDRRLPASLSVRSHWTKDHISLRKLWLRRFPPTRFCGRSGTGGGGYFSVGQAPYRTNGFRTGRALHRMNGFRNGESRIEDPLERSLQGPRLKLGSPDISGVTCETISGVCVESPDGTRCITVARHSFPG